MNNYQSEISKVIESAQTSIQVAMSWFTDELLIEKLISKAKRIKIELLLSSDELNLLRHKHFKILQEAGAKVQKTGSDDAVLGNFMHAKFIIIDGVEAFGGSYNFTQNAKSNHENFKKYATEEVVFLLRDFNNWFKQSVNLFEGVVNPEDVVKKLKEKFLQEERKRMSWIERTFSNDKINEKQLIEQYHNQAKDIAKRQVYSENGVTSLGNNSKEQVVEKNVINAPKPVYLHNSNIIIGNEIKKDNLRSITNAIVTGSATIAPSGTPISSNQGVRYSPHRFYGGQCLSNFSGNKVKESFKYAFSQKRVIEQKYSFLKCEIKSDILICRGVVQPEGCEKYNIRIEFRAGSHPKVFITSHELENISEIHVYRDGSLCLFYPPDIKWKDTTSIAHNTIPWTIEWIHFYEIWKLTGKWEGVEVKH